MACLNLVRLAICTFVFITLVHAQRFDIGDRLIRDYTEYHSLPSTASDASAAGWVSNGTCTEGLGIAYTFNATFAQKQYPITLFFTPAGQAAGIRVTVFGEVKANLIKHGYFIEVNNNEFFIAVSFRDTNSVCSSAKSSYYLGDRLVVNQNTVAADIPVLVSDLAAKGWVKGSCFAGMGYHYFYDIQVHMF